MHPHSEPCISHSFVLSRETCSSRYEGVFTYLFFYFSMNNIYCGYSLEALHRGASNEYPQHMFLCRNKKNIIITYRLIKVPYLEL